MIEQNRLSITGRLTDDPEFGYTSNKSVPVATFSIANKRTFIVDNEKREDVSFFNCVAWGKLGEVIHKYFGKGDRIIVDGYIHQKRWKDHVDKKRSAVEIVVENFNFGDSKKDDEK